MFKKFRFILPIIMLISGLYADTTGVRLQRSVDGLLRHKIHNLHSTGIAGIWLIQDTTDTARITINASGNLLLVPDSDLEIVLRAAQNFIIDEDGTDFVTIDRTATAIESDATSGTAWYMDFDDVTSGTGLFIDSDNNALIGGELVKIEVVTTQAWGSVPLAVYSSGANATSGRIQYGIFVELTGTGTNSQNLALYTEASGGTYNYALYIGAGDINTTSGATDWELKDNNASALSFDATGAAGILNIITTEVGEGISFTSPATGTTDMYTYTATGNFADGNVVKITDSGTPTDGTLLRVLSVHATPDAIVAGDATNFTVIASDGSIDFSTATAGLITSSAGNIEIAPATDIVLDPTGNNVLPGSADTDHLGSVTLEWGNFYQGDNKFTYYGLEQDISVGYDESTNDALEYKANVDGTALPFVWKADRGDDQGDEAKWNLADGGVLTYGSDIASAGSYVTHLTLTPHATLTTSSLAFVGDVDVGDDLLMSNLGVINWNSDVTMTHSSDLLTITGGNTRVDKLEINGANDYMNVSTDLDIVSNVDMVLTAGGNEIHVIGGLSVGDETDVGDNNFKVVGTSSLIGNVTFEATTSWTDGTDTFSASVASDKWVLWDDAGTPNELVVVDSSGKVSIGTTSMDSKLLVVGESGTGIIKVIDYSSDEEVHAGAFFTQRARGTQASPSAILSGDRIGIYIFGGYNGTSFKNTAAIYAQATENFSASDEGTKFVFEITPNGATSRSAVMVIDQSGYVAIGGTEDPGTILEVVDDNGNAAHTLFTMLNDDETSSGETGQTVDLVFEVMDSIGAAAPTPHEAAKISAYKIGDFFHATTEADHDAGMKWWTVTDGAYVLNTTLSDNDMTVVGTITGGDLTIGDITISDNDPVLNYVDETGADDDVNVTIAVDLVTATSGAEDATVTIQNQVDGTMRDMLVNVVEGDFTLTSYKGQIILKSANTTALTLEADQDAVLAQDLDVVAALTALTLQTDTDITAGVLANDVMATLSIIGDAENDNATPVNETYSAVLVQNANPNLAFLQWSTTQSTVGMDFDMPITASTVNGLTIVAGSNTFDLSNGSGSLNIAATKTLNIDQHFTVNGTGTTITGVTQANTITLYESFTVAGGFNFTVTAEDVAGSIVLDKQTFEVEGEQTATRLMKLVNANDAAATLTIEGTSAVVNQDVTSDANVSFAKVITTEVEFAGNILLDPAVDGASYVDIANSGTGAAKLYIEGDQIISDDLSDVASIAMLDEGETVTGAWTFQGAVDAAMALILEADAGADNPDTWQILIADGDEFALQAYAGGSYADALTIVGSTLAADFPGNLTIATKYVYRADGTDVPDADVADNITITNISQVQDISASAAEINTPLDGASVTLTEFQELETIDATTISANQWALLGGLAGTLTSAEVNILDGVTGVVAAEISYIGDVTGLIQAQLNAKAPLANPTFTGLVKRSVTAGITAVNPGGQGDGALTSDINEVSVVGADNDAVTLPTAVAGYEVFIANNGANTLEIFPAAGDNLGAGVNTATTLISGANITFVAFDATNWETK